MARPPSAPAHRARSGAPAGPLVADRARRVLLVNDLAPQEGGGVESHLASLARVLEESGDTVELFAGEVQHRGARRVLDVWDPAARGALAALAARFRPDVVHHHNVLRELSAAVLGVPPGAACVMTVHDVRLLSGREGFSTAKGWSALTIAKRLKAVLDRAVVGRRVDLLVAHSRAVTDRLSGPRFPPVRLVPPFASPPPSTAPPSAGQEIVYAGRLAPEKGVDVLLAAFSLIAGRYPDARLRFVGDGPERARLAAAAEAGPWRRRVELTGRLAPADVALHLGRARAVAVPSRGPEGGPLVVVEAALAGRPIVVSDVPGAAELVHDGGGGLVVPPGDPPALAAALSRLLDSGQEADRLGSLARAHALTRHTAAVFVPALHAVYDEAVARHTRRSGADSPARPNDV